MLAAILLAPVVPSPSPSPSGVPPTVVPEVVERTQHAMTPTGVAAMIALALVVDYMSVGPNSVRDRIAFLIGLAAIRDGFQGSVVETWTVTKVAQLVAAGLKAGQGKLWIAGASANALIGVGVAVLAVYCVGVLLPVRAGSKLGGFARLSFSKQGGKSRVTAVAAPDGGRQRLNGRLWCCACILGLCADLPQGAIGGALRAGIGFVTGVVAGLPNLLFGA